MMIPSNCSDLFFLKKAVHSNFCCISCDGNVVDYHGVDAHEKLVLGFGERALRDGYHHQGVAAGAKIIHS